VNELTVGGSGLSGALAEGPGGAGIRFAPRPGDRASQYVVDRLLENGWIKQAEADKAARTR